MTQDVSPPTILGHELQLGSEAYRLRWYGELGDAYVSISRRGDGLVYASAVASHRVLVDARFEVGEGETTHEAMQRVADVLAVILRGDVHPAPDAASQGEGRPDGRA